MKHIREDEKNIDIEGRKLSHTHGHIVHDVASPEKSLALAILNKAKEEAEDGDIAALTFLLLDGQRLEQLILNDIFDQRETVSESPVFRFVERTWARLEQDEDAHFFNDGILAKELRLLRSEIKKERQAIEEAAKAPRQIAFTKNL
jgi:hypothetical protein